MATPLRIRTVEELAEAMAIPIFVLRRFTHHADKYYKTFRLPKRSGRGMRQIAAPIRALKGIQRWILYFILRPREHSDACTGFRPQMSVVNNAEPHVNQDFVASVDISEFFPTISAKRVFGLFNSLGYSDAVAFSLTRLCTFRGALSQGAPTSPDIANLICRKLDTRLEGICKHRGWNYTRYADDLTISGRGVGERATDLLDSIVRDEGFEPNPRKSRTHRRGDRQVVTGLVVNAHVAVPRHWRRRLRALLHKLSLNDPEAIAMTSRIEGMLSFLKMVQPSCPLLSKGEAILNAKRGM